MMNRKRPLVRKDVETRRKKLKLENKKPESKILSVIESIVEMNGTAVTSKQTIKKSGKVLGKKSKISKFGKASENTSYVDETQEYDWNSESKMEWTSEWQDNNLNKTTKKTKSKKVTECQANEEQENWSSRLRPTKARTRSDWAPRLKPKWSTKWVADVTTKSATSAVARKLTVDWKKKDAKPGEGKISFDEYAALVHYCILGGGNRKPFWCAVRNFRGSAQFVLFRINCATSVLQAFSTKFKSCHDFFSSGVRFKFYSTDRDEFWINLLNVNDANKVLMKQFIKRNGDILEQMRPDMNAEFNRLHLLASFNEMVDMSYPIPNPMILASKDKYKKVTENSPIFVLDCEMCQTRCGSEVTRVSVVDEKGRVFLDTLVMPDNKIFDYVTKYSGITEEILSGVTTTLSDVQEVLKYCLPDDAILCGHSFNSDLLALRLSHPYCIDTSLIYNLSGKAGIKTGLKNLTKMFMKKQIQGSGMGHCSVEDCKATLELLDLKLANDYAFGNVLQGFDPGSLTKPEEKPETNGDFEQTQVKSAVKLPKPVPKFCSSCGEKYSTICAIDGCSCKTSGPTECCKCMVIKAKREREKNDSDEEYFDWNEATRMEGIRSTAPITKVLNKPDKGLLCAIREATNILPNSTGFCQVTNNDTFKDLDDFSTQMGETMYEYKFSCFEHDLTSKSDEDCQKLDESISYLIKQCTNRNTVCSLVLSSKKDSVAYVKVRT